MEHPTRGVHISAGDGIVAHVANLTALACGDEAGLNELLVRLNALAGEPWQEIVRTLTSGISEIGYDNHPSLACVSVEDDKVAALVFGATTLAVTIDGTETVLDGRDSSTWIDVALRGTVERVHAGEQAESTVVGVLRDGVVPAGGFLLDTSGPIPASERWSEIAAAAVAEPPAPELVVAEPVAPEPAAPEPAVAVPVAEPEPVAPELAAVPVAEPVEPVIDEVHAESTSTAAPETFPVATSTATDEEAEDTDPTDTDPETNAVASAATSRSMFARIEEIGRAVTNERNQTSEELFSESPFEQGPTPSPNTNGSDVESYADDKHVLTPHRPQLKGVLCDAGHLTAPVEMTCRTCGDAIPTGAKAASGDRPALGTIAFDDGAVLNIDRPAAIGSNVPAGYVIDGEPATIVRLDDGVGGVSDIQLEVRLSGWNVEIVDMDSENGTYTMLRGERQTRTKLRSNQSVVLQPAMEVQAGGRSFVYSVGPDTTD